VALSVVTRFRRPARTELFWSVGRAERLRLSAELVTLAGRAVVFCRNVPEAIRVASDLSRIGVPAASVEHRDFASSRVRARVVSDETALSCGRNSSSCIIQFDPAVTARRYRRRLDLVANDRATVVSFVVPEREAEVRRLLRSLDLPDVLTRADITAVIEALAIAARIPEVDDAPDDTESRARHALAVAGAAVRHVPRGASKAGHAISRRVLNRRRADDEQAADERAADEPAADEPATGDEPTD
jgi:hypothetical protein